MTMHLRKSIPIALVLADAVCRRYAKIGQICFTGSERHDEIARRQLDDIGMPSNVPKQDAIAESRSSVLP